MDDMIDDDVFLDGDADADVIPGVTVTVTDFDNNQMTMTCSTCMVCFLLLLQRFFSSLVAFASGR